MRTTSLHGISRPAFLAALALALHPVAAQEAKTLDRGKTLIAEVRARLKVLTEPQAPQDAEDRLDKAIEAVAAEPKAVSHDDYLDTAQLLFRAHRYQACAQLCSAATTNLEDKTGLLDYLGMSHLALAQDMRNNVEAREIAKAAIEAFVAARAGKSVTLPNRLFLNQAYAVNCEFDRALADYDEVVVDYRFAKHFPENHHETRGLFLLCAGKFEAAAVELTDKSLSVEDRKHSVALRIRALAMSGKLQEAELQARDLWRQKSDEGHTGLLADVLAIAGKREEALRLLKEHPVARDGSSEQTFAGCQQARAAFEYLIGVAGQRPKDLRQQLARLLGHHFEVMGGDAAGEDAKMMAVSPLCLGSVLRQAPTSPKDWANNLMFLVCVVDAVGYVPNKLEEIVLKYAADDATRVALTGEDAKARAHAILFGSLMMYEDGGVLTAIQLAAKL